MYQNQRFREHLGEMCLVFEKFICGFKNPQLSLATGG
jgi:hypothetical protein